MELFNKMNFVTRHNQAFSFDDKQLYSINIKQIHLHDNQPSCFDDKPNMSYLVAKNSTVPLHISSLTSTSLRRASGPKLQWYIFLVP